MTSPKKMVIQSLIMLRISSNISIPLTEIEIQAVRAQGSGGQNVNKVATAVHLRFDIKASSLRLSGIAVRLRTEKMHSIDYERLSKAPLSR